MDARFQPSFIPKQPIAQLSPSGPAHVSVLYVVALIVFILTLGLVAGVLISEHLLNQDIAALNQQITDARQSFEISTIQELQRVSERLDVASQLVSRHVALSKFFEALQAATYQNVSFSSLSAQSNDAGGFTVKLAGIAGSYNSMILQSEKFDALPFLTGQQFSNFSLDNRGDVSFSFTASINPALVNYAQYLTQ